MAKLSNIIVQCVFFVEHAVYTFTSLPAKRGYNVHLEVKGRGGELICDIAADLKVLQFVRRKGNYQCGNCGGGGNNFLTIR